MATIWLSTRLKCRALSCSYARLLASDLQRPDILHVSTSDSAACQLIVKAARYASTSEFTVSAGSVKASAYASTSAASMETLSFKQDATKELELDETNASLGHMARMDM